MRTGPRRSLRALAALALSLSAPVGGADAQEQAGSLPPAFAELQALDARVQSIGWQLAHGNAAYCQHRVRGIGLQLHDVFGYDDPAAVRRSLGLASDIAVAAVAMGGPAAAAGLAANDPLSEVAGQLVAALPSARPGDFARLAGLHDRIDAALAATGRVELAVLRGPAEQRLTIPGQEVCASRFEMLTQSSRAAADGSRVVVGRKLVTFLSDDEQLAALLSHELAHNVLGHRKRLAEAGRNWKTIRSTEREADRLSAWLLANAGYDPAAALRFMARWGPPNDNGIFSTPDHDRWRTRFRLIEAELPRLAAARAADPAGRADWSRSFVPQDKLERGETGASPHKLLGGRESR